MANLSNINNILRTGSLGVGINRDPASPFEVSSATKPGIKMFNTATSGKTYQAYSDVNGNYIIYDEDADSNRLIISGSGNATFAGKILVGVGTTAAASINAFSTTVSTGLHSALRIISQPSASNYWDIGATNGASTILNFYHNGSTTPKISFTHLGGATFAGQVGVAGKTPAYGLTLAQGTGVNNKIAWTDGTPSFRASIYANSSNDKFTIATGNASSVETTALEIDTSQNATFAGNSITVDPASGDAILQLQSSTQTLRVDQNSIRTTTNTNLSFLTNSTLALTLDTSQNATFAGSVDVGTFTLAGSGIVADAGMTLQIGGGSVNALTLADSSGNATFAGTVETTTLRTDVVNNKANSANIIYRSGTSTLVGGGTTVNKLYVLDNGNVGIGTTSPSSKLHVTGAPANGVYLSYLYNSGTHNSSHGLNVQTAANNIATYGLRVNTGGDSNALAVMGNGNVGIGTASPSAKLEIVTAVGADAIRMNYGQSADIFLGFASANPRILLQDNSNVVTHNFQSNGDNYIVGSNVAIGTTVPDQTGYGYKTLTIMGGTNAGDSGVIELLAPNVDADDQNYGIVSFGAGGTRTAMISANRKAANNAANLRFWTAPGGAGIQERMRIDKDGQVMIRRTADYSTDKYLLQVGDASLDDCIPAVFTVASTSARNQIVFSNFNNNLVGTIITSGSATSYNTSSDYRLKEDLKDFAGLEKISNIKVYDFKWKDNDNYDEHSKRGYGVLAHELQEVLPNAVSGEKDAEEMQGVDYSKIVPLLVKSIQELEARVKELENN